MENFTIYNPTKLHFGKNVTDKLGMTIEQYGKKVLLVYGKGSIKKNGIYDRVMEQLNGIGAEVTEYSGIKPNPVVEDVNAAAELGRKYNVDVILAVGGGSVIDSAKMIALTIPASDSAWRIMIKMSKPKTAVPLITVLTLAATGTEMNPFAVLQNVQTHKKIGYGNPLIYPKHSFLDPSFTFSVSREYTGYGIADLIAHALENYFGAGDASLSDKFVYSIIGEAMEFGPELLDDLQNYDLRAKIMYAATNALNGLTSYGRVVGDWGVHSTGHVLSLLYDSPHGATLTVAYPAWLKIIMDRDPGRISELGKNLFGKPSPEETITAFENLFAKLSCPLKMKDLNIDESKKGEIIEMMIKNKVDGNNYKLSKNDLERIVNLMYSG
jgi:alcohol dehydrogenase YqhD (iron-dependent ADH family)